MATPVRPAGEPRVTLAVIIGAHGITGEVRLKVFAEDVSACDRPYGDSPPSNIASFPFAPNKQDLRKIRRQLKQ